VPLRLSERKGLFVEEMSCLLDTAEHENGQIVFIDIENYSAYHFSMNENSRTSRWSKDQIKAMLLDQFESLWSRDTGTERTQLDEIERVANY
jgi:hypothetical protein